MLVRPGIAGHVGGCTAHVKAYHSPPIFGGVCSRSVPNDASRRTGKNGARSVELGDRGEATVRPRTQHMVSDQ